MTFSSLGSALIFLWAGKDAFGRKPVCGEPSGISSLHSIISPPNFSALQGDHGFESPQLRYAHVRIGRRAMIKATVPFTSLRIIKGLESGSYFPHLGSCTCTVDTFMNILCFSSSDFCVEGIHGRSLRPWRVWLFDIIILWCK